MSFDFRQYLAQFNNRRTAVMLFLGFSSGLPLMLTSGTMQAWLTVADIDIRVIGLFGLVGLPYTLKFLWSPIMDRYVPPWLGRRRGWMIVTQFALLAGIGCMALLSPQQTPWLLAGLALTVAFISASQDIVFDAYRADVLHTKERGMGAGLTVTGYRMAMLVSGAAALVLSDQIGWQATYLVMAALMAVGIVTTVMSPEPEWRVVAPVSLDKAAWEPFKEFLSRPAAISILVLIILYKLGDAFAGSLSTAFLIRGVGFTVTEVGTISKGFGLFALITGALIGGALMANLGLFRSLLAFGILQAVSNLAFMALAWTGKNYTMMMVAVAFENFSAGMGTSAFVALLMALCDHRYTATQFALFSALSAVGRVFAGPVSGYLVKAVDWMWFFAITFVIAIPGLVLLWWLRKPIEIADSRNNDDRPISTV